MSTLRDLINRLQAIKDSGSFIQLSNFIEELERMDEANAMHGEPVAPVPAVPPVEAIAVAAGPNAPAQPGVEPLNAFGAAALALDIIAAREDETTDPNFVDPDATIIDTPDNP